MALSEEEDGLSQLKNGARERVGTRRTAPSVDEGLEVLAVLQLRLVLALLLLGSLRLGRIELSKVT